MNTKIRLAVLYFLQFAVWGSYLTCLGQFLGRAGLGREISWFYSAVGIVSLFMPAAMGYIADKRASASRLLSVCHFVAACFMFSAWAYVENVVEIRFAPLFALYLLFLAFFMPTIALANTTAFAVLKREGMKAVESFPAVRVFGTVGFVAAMWFVNSAYVFDGSFGMTLSESSPSSPFRFQYTDMMLLTSGIAGLLTSLYALTLPAVRVPDRNGVSGRGLSGFLGLRSMDLFNDRAVVRFLLFAVLAGVCLQITNGFATPFISHFAAIPEYSGNAAAGNATMLFSLSQISEAACILLIPFAMRRWGFRNVVTVSLVAWALRFAFFGWGNPGYGLWMLVLSMIVYGIAFDFFNIAGSIFMEEHAPAGEKGRAQGVLMLMSNGLGATFGMMGAGAVVNSFCRWQQTAGGRYFMGDWQSVWLIFAVYALIIAVAFFLCFRSGSLSGKNC